MTESKPDGLLACPCCDAAASIDMEHAPYARWCPEYEISCGECGLSTSKFRSEAEAIAAWNTRPAPIAAGEGNRDEIFAALVNAYSEGCIDVHRAYEPDIDPDFTEAAHDYAHSKIDALLPSGEASEGKS